jgi:AhpD family alkylhydroperoxidase
MQARMNPEKILGGMNEPVQQLIAAVRGGGVEGPTLELVHQRVSQINGCAWCLDFGARTLSKAGEAPERLATLPAWREAPYFTDAERAALALAEAATRIADHPDPVSDEIWEAAAKHFNEKQLAAIVVMIGLTNFFNHVNVPTRRVAGTWD